MKLSIITINLNNANGLKQTLVSVAGQTFKDFEHIIIDGASTDNSLEVMGSFSHIKYYVSEPDNGIYNAMNKGVKIAKGEYCLFLNSGDYLLKSTTLSDFFSYNFSQDIIYGDTFIKIKNRLKLRKSKPENNFYIADLDCLWHQAAFIKRKLLNELNCYRTDFKISSDYDFFLRAIFKENASYKYISIAISIFMHGGVSSNRELLLAERKISLRDNFPLLCKNIEHQIKLSEELRRVYKIPGVKFLMKYIYPLYRKIKYKLTQTPQTYSKYS